MKQNMSNADRFIRLLLAAIIVALYVARAVSGFWGIVLLIVAGVLVLTSLVRFCPLYGACGISTRSAGKKGNP